MNFTLSEQEHHYGPTYHLLCDPVLNSFLTQLCLSETEQPLVNHLIESLYSSLIQVAANNEFPLAKVERLTRMSVYHPSVHLKSEVIDRDQKTVVVNLARAGTLPSQVSYQKLNYLLNPKQVRQDHVMIARATSADGAVTGADLGAAKIGGDVEGAVVFFPDPMGATGSTLVKVLDYYKNKVEGRARAYVAINLIVTPEYLRALKKHHPDVHVYALRLDRGLSSPEVLAAPLGQHWDQERGLDERMYIVPGAGGVGEIMNNSFV